MSEQKFPEGEIRPEDMSLDELISSTKAEIENGAPTTFEPTLPAEYAELVSEEDEQMPDEDAAYEEERFRMPGLIKGLLYVCCVMAVAIVLAVFAWKCADEVCALTADEQVVTVTVPENATMNQVTNLLYDNGLVGYKWLFSLYCMISNAEEKIDPGTYQLNTVFDYHALVYGMIETSENRATVSVTIPEGYEAEDIFRLLEENELDFAVAEGFFDKTRFDSFLLHREPFVGICRRDHPFAGREVTIEELLEETIIHREDGSGTRAILEQELLGYNESLQRFQRHICISSFNIILDLVKQGLGVSFVYNILADSDPELAKFSMRGKHVVREFNVVYLKYGDIQEKTRLFLEGVDPPSSDRA